MRGNSSFSFYSISGPLNDCLLVSVIRFRKRTHLHRAGQTQLRIELNRLCLWGSSYWRTCNECILMACFFSKLLVKKFKKNTRVTALTSQPMLGPPHSGNTNWPPGAQQWHLRDRESRIASFSLYIDTVIQKYSYLRDSIFVPCIPHVCHVQNHSVRSSRCRATYAGFNKKPHDCSPCKQVAVVHEGWSFL